jgi:hypothetical protein
MSALFCKEFGDGAPDSTAGTGDDGDLTM